MAKTKQPPTIEPLELAGITLDPAQHKLDTPNDVLEALGVFGDHVSAWYDRTGGWHALHVELKSAEAVRAYRRVHLWLNTLALTPPCGRYITRELRDPCADCGVLVRREGLAGHRGSPLCLEAQRIAALRTAGYVNAGTAYRAIEKAGVDVQWVPTNVGTGLDDDGAPTFTHADAVRVAPEWAVRIAECTVVPHDLRIVTLEHCRDHKKARDGLWSALRLGGVGGAVKAQRNKNSDKRAQRGAAKRMRELFETALLQSD